MHGELLVQGSKNAALPILAAAVLADGIFVLHHCPEISDVDHMLELLQTAGCRVRREGHMVILDTRSLDNHRITGSGAGKMRSTITLLGSMLGRLHQVEIPYPGGCTIGKRPIDLHLSGLRLLGADFRQEEHTLCGSADRLHGAQICLHFPSVGATENLMLAAVLSEGVTVIHGAAMEPEICVLAEFLRKMGAKVRGDGTPCVTIEGVKKLDAVEYIIPSDRIVAGTYLGAVLCAGGRVFLEQAPAGHMERTIETARQMGATVESLEEGIRVSMRGRPHPIRLETGPYPEFPTDMQSVMMAAASVADGISRIQENVFENRFCVAKELQKLGAHIIIENKLAVVDGVNALKGTRVAAEDLRGGAALAVAALAADGTSFLDGYEHISRGYEDIRSDLAGAGARISLIG